MENLKHTAGQWIANKSTDDMIIRQGENGFVIAEVTSGVSHFINNKKEAEANRTLIAAAPTLLNAAILCENITDKCNNAMLPQHVQELLKSLNDTLKAAINKAIN